MRLSPLSLLPLLLAAAAAAEDPGLRGTLPADSPAAPLRGTQPAEPSPATAAAPSWLRKVKDGHMVDLREQFGLPRRQGRIGACSPFAAVALLEAARMRKGQCVSLSEADLFIESVVLRKRCRLGGCAGMDEGQGLQNALAWALENGVLLGDDYDAFAAEYRRWKTHNEVHNAMHSTLERFLDDPFTYSTLASDPETLEWLHRYRGDDAENRGRQRRMVRGAYRGYAVREREFPVADAPWALKGMDCAKQGREREALIVGELRAGRPVGLAAMVANLPSWGEGGGPPKPGDPGWHAFVLTGYTQNDRTGFRAFATRNSWGRGRDFPFYSSDMCRVKSVVTVLAPGEEPTF